MKTKFKGDLRSLYEQKSIIVRKDTIEYIVYYKHNDSYRITCVGVNSSGVYFKGTIHDCLKGAYYFQYDLDQTYLKVKENPISIYNL